MWILIHADCDQNVMLIAAMPQEERSSVLTVNYNWLSRDSRPIHDLPDGTEILVDLPFSMWTWQINDFLNGTQPTYDNCNRTLTKATVRFDSLRPSLILLVQIAIVVIIK